MKKIALFLMLVMACFMFISCDPITGTGGTGGNGGENSGQTGGNGGSNGGNNGTVTEPIPDVVLPPAKDEPSKEDTKDLLKEAVDLLLETKIDEGIAKIREAYAEQQNSETAMYYALAELASISVDKSVETLLKENMGIKNYPAKMNSLISGDWMKEYPVAYDRYIYEVTENEGGGYVRVSGTKTDHISNDDVRFSYSYYEGDWVGTDYTYECLTDVALDPNGDYLVDYDYLPDYIDYSTATRYNAKSILLGFEESEHGDYVKFSGTLVEDTSNFISGYTVNENKESIGFVYLEDVELSETGDYFVEIWDLSGEIDTSSVKRYNREWNSDLQCENFVESEYGNYVRVSGTIIKIFIVHFYVKENNSWVQKSTYFRDVTVGSGNYFGYYYDFNNSDTSSATKYRLNRKSKMVQEDTVSLPEFNVPTWFKDTEYDEKFNSTYTAQAVSYLFMANALECNSTGLNKAFDNILAVFGTKFANAKALAASLSDASVEIPSKVFDAFGLEELLDGQSSLKVGKAELNVLVASMEILKGTFQWLASYDWSLNLSYLKAAFIDDFYSDELIYDAFENTVTEKTLAVRNAQLMTDSKNSFLSAISLVESSYNYLVGDTSQYPDVYVDKIKEIGDVYLEGLKALKKSIQDGGIFFVPDDEWDMESWPTTASNTMMQIDMGKFFTAGYLTDIIERDDSGKVKFYLRAFVGDGEELFKYTPVKDFNKIEEEGDAFAGDEYWNLCFAIDADKIDALVGTFFEWIGFDYSGDKIFIEYW